MDLLVTGTVVCGAVVCGTVGCGAVGCGCGAGVPEADPPPSSSMYVISYKGLDPGLLLEVRKL